MPAVKASETLKGMITEPATESLESIATHLGQRLARLGLLLATAESCTGGWVAKIITDIPGSSAWFDRGFVTYSNAAKQDMLGVLAETLAEHGAVSEAVVREMADGALRCSASQVSIAISGVAGPGGGLPEKPVGTVWIAWGISGRQLIAERFLFAGNRDAVREAAVMAALVGLSRQLIEYG